MWLIRSEDKTVDFDRIEWLFLFTVPTLIAKDRFVFRWAIWRKNVCELVFGIKLKFLLSCFESERPLVMHLFDSASYKMLPTLLIILNACSWHFYLKLPFFSCNKWKFISKWVCLWWFCFANFAWSYMNEATPFKSPTVEF